MADTSNLTNFLTDVADAIRTKKETTGEISAANFDTEILSISTATLQANKNATPITSQQVITPDTGYDGMEQVTIAPAVMSAEDYDTCMDLADYIMYGEEQPLLPYTELEYIQSTGTQYINTNISPNSSQRIEMTFVLDAVVRYEGLWGVTNNGAPTRGNVTGNYGSSNFFVIKHSATYGKGETLEVTIDTGTKYVLEVDYSTKQVYRDRLLVGSYTDNLSSTSKPIYVLQRTDSNVSSSKAKLYGFKIYTNNVLTMNLIPVKRISDNAVCMYDKVSNEFFTNAGTGVFTAGPEKEVV